MRIFRKLFWVLLALSIVGIGYNIWFFGLYPLPGLRAWTSLLIFVSWGWFALTAVYPIYAFVQLLRRSPRTRFILLHVLAFMALVGVFNPRGVADALDLRGFSLAWIRNWVFGLSATYLVSFAYWRFTHFMQSRNQGKSSEAER